MPYTPNTPPHRKQLHLRQWLGLILLVAAALVAMYLLFFTTSDTSSDSAIPSATPESTSESEESSYKPVNLQPIVDSWNEGQPATFGIVIHDLQSDTTIATVADDREFFAASLYKQFVAYLALLDIQNSAMDADETLWNGRTNKECVDMMIRESHSPCGEAMMAKIGQLTLNQRIADMGMTGTYFNGIRTTAHDSALILRYIAQGRDLNEENTAFLRDAMHNQDDKWRRGLARGAPEARWETKVGWNEDINYHDIGIMTLPDGRVFAIAILGEGSGSSAPIADFAKIIYDALAE